MFDVIVSYDNLRLIIKALYLASCNEPILYNEILILSFRCNKISQALFMLYMYFSL